MSDEVKIRVRNTVEWMRSPEGQEALRKAREAAEEVVRELQETRKVHWLDMLRPMDI